MVGWHHLLDGHGFEWTLGVVVIYTVKGFGVINKAEVDVFLV